MAGSGYPSKNLRYIVNSTMGGNVTGASIPIEIYENYFIQAVVTGGSSPTGAFKLQCSADNTSWTDVASSSQSITDNGTVVWNVTGAQYFYVRLAYTFTSGTGTLNAQYNLKP